MPSAWTRLNREETRDALDRLGAQRDALVFSRDTTEVSFRALPFYSRYELYRLANYATMPVFTMTYLSDGEEFIALDGTEAPIYAANEKDPIRLNEMNVVAYLDFFFSNVHGEDGDVFLIKDPRKMPFLSSLTGQQQQSVVNNFKPLKVEHDAAPNIFRVSGTLYYGGGLMASTVLVTPQGVLSFEDQRLLLAGIRFPDSIAHDHAWAEG